MKSIFLRFQFSSLMIFLLLLFFLYPFLEKLETGQFVLGLFITGVMLNAVYSILDHKYFRILAFVVAGPIVFFRLVLSPEANTVLSMVATALEVVLLVVTTCLILAHVLQARKVTGETIAGAVCVYLLVAFNAALLFGWIYDRNPAAFSAGAAEFPFSDALYFSLVTLTTLGYGDISPLVTEARMLAALEALFGQLYLAVLIARLVGIHAASRRNLDPPE
jgi:hypothetical protein